MINVITPWMIDILLIVHPIPNCTLDVPLFQVLTIAVLSIVLTAPIGAAAIGILGPCLLEKSTDNNGEICISTTICD